VFFVELQKEKKLWIKVKRKQIYIEKKGSKKSTTKKIVDQSQKETNIY